MIAANYFDGRSARLHPVMLATSEAGIAISGPGIDRLYPMAEVSLAEPFVHAPATLYFADGARCEVHSPGATGQLAETTGYRPSRVVRLQARWPAALAVLALLVSAMGATAFWGVPAAAARISATLPPSVDLTMGRSSLAGLEKERVLEPTRLGDERVAVLEQVFRSIAPAHPRVPLRLLVRASEQLGPNALALPDGTIIITDEMVRFIQGREPRLNAFQKTAIAGVLAHEIGHVEHRHSVRTLTSTSLVAAASASLFGDFSGVAAGAPALLMSMRYSRAMEIEADDYALAQLQRHALSAEPLAQLFEAFDKDDAARYGRSVPTWFDDVANYASSHPSGTDRSARLRRGRQARN